MSHDDPITGQSNRIAQLMTDNAMLRNDLATLKGENALPARGCSFHETYIGDAPLLCEYEHDPASGDGWDEERIPATVALVRVFVNGKWINPQDFMSAEMIDDIETRILGGLE